jgi:hypothetical protein
MRPLQALMEATGNLLRRIANAASRAVRAVVKGVAKTTLRPKQ